MIAALRERWGSSVISHRKSDESIGGAGCATPLSFSVGVMTTVLRGDLWPFWDAFAWSAGLVCSAPPYRLKSAWYISACSPCKADHAPVFSTTMVGEKENGGGERVPDFIASVGRLWARTTSAVGAGANGRIAGPRRIAAAGLGSIFPSLAKSLVMGNL